MIVYSRNSLAFRNAVDTNKITNEIENVFIQRLGRSPPPGEKVAWNNSVRFMESIIRDSKIADRFVIFMIKNCYHRTLENHYPEFVIQRKEAKLIWCGAYDSKYVEQNKAKFDNVIWNL